MKTNKTVFLILAIIFLVLGIYFIITNQWISGSYVTRSGNTEKGGFSGYFLICMSVVVMWFRSLLDIKDKKK